MCTALAPRIGYDAAAAVAKRAYQSGRTVREVTMDLVGRSPEQAAGVIGVRPNGGVLTADEVDRLLDPHGQTVRGTGVGGSAGG